jgi:hypothetical protein
MDDDGKSLIEDKLLYGYGIRTGREYPISTPDQITESQKSQILKKVFYRVCLVAFVTAFTALVGFLLRWESFSFSLVAYVIYVIYVWFLEESGEDHCHDFPILMASAYICGLLIGWLLVATINIPIARTMVLVSLMYSAFLTVFLTTLASLPESKLSNKSLLIIYSVMISSLSVITYQTFDNSFALIVLMFFATTVIGFYTFIVVEQMIVEDISKRDQPSRIALGLFSIAFSLFFTILKFFMLGALKQRQMGGGEVDIINSNLKQNDKNKH